MFIKGNNVYQITIYGIKQPSDSLFSIIGDFFVRKTTGIKNSKKANKSLFLSK